MSKSTKTLAVLVSITIALVVIVVGGYMALTGTNDSPSAESPASPLSKEKSTKNNPNDKQFPDGNTPGASVEGDQRSWPDVLDGDIDAQFATPGQYATEPVSSRRVFTPRNPLGDLPAASALVEQPDACENTDLAGKTQLQYVKARFLAVNTEAGPSRMERAVPRGYAHSPQGAVMAAINQLGYGLPAQGDEVGEEIDKALWADSAQVAQERADKNLDTEGPSRLARASTMPGATGYKIISCGGDLMVVDVVYGEPTPGRPETAMAARMSLRWTNNDWVVDLSGSNDAAISRPAPDSLDGYTLVDYQ